ncbi:MAG: DUF4139 domain-containing protein [Eubacteriaceae bacterium]|nr:DUF4139 domain-containing protein [Eubacteriaceae bacterium]
MSKLSNAADNKEIALTIYSSGFGAVKEVRKVNLTGVETELIFGDVAQLIETDSLLVEGIEVLEFNYDFDLVSRDKLLTKYIDKEVFLKDRKTGVKKACRLLSVEGEGKCVLEDRETKEIYLDTQEEIVLPSLPSGLIVKPALVWKIAKSVAETVKVSYLSKGFNWKANYVVELMEKTFNIIGWAEIENLSGATFENARIKLIAGDVKRVEDELSVIEDRYMLSKSTMAQAEEKTFFDYHMYTLHHPTTVKNQQTKQINILNGGKIPFKQYYKLDRYEEKADIVIEFNNNKKSGLGIPLPRGKIKLYKTDEDDGSLEFIGEDLIDHTPKDEIVQLTVGKAFDITFKYTESDKKMQNGFEHHEQTCRIKNHKEEVAEVRFEHAVWGIWEMVSSTHKYKKKSANLIEFVVNVPADAEIVVKFEYKIDIRKEIIIKK